MHPEYLRFSRRYHSPSSLVGANQASAAVHPAVNFGPQAFQRLSEQKLRDDKMSFRSITTADAGGQLSGYYFYDNSNWTIPILLSGRPNVPGFNALNLGLRSSSTWPDKDIWHFHGERGSLEFMGAITRSASLLAGRWHHLVRRFCHGSRTPGIFSRAVDRGIENVVFNSFVMGIITTSPGEQYVFRDGQFSRVLDNHTIKTGLEVSYKQIRQSGTHF